MSFNLVAGERQTGQDVRTENVTAALAIANILKTSLGPVGLDKMLVDDVGDVLITNDGATILKRLEVEHPAARVLVELSSLQDEEVGDGTTSVVLLAAELLRRANDLVKNKIHPTSIIAGLQVARREACKYIQDNLSVPVESLGRECLVNTAKTSMSSKIIGGDADHFAEMVVDAVTAIKSTDSQGRPRYPTKMINILKSQGRSSSESTLIPGFALNCSKASQAMPSHIRGAKIAVLDFNLNKTRLQMGVQVLIDDPNQLPQIQKRESDITKERIQMILRSGANVVLTTKGIDDLSLKYFVEAGAIAVRRCTKEDLRRIAKATGATMVLTLANLDGEESFDESYLGHADEVVEEKVGDGELLYFKGCKHHNTRTLLLRGANEYMLDEMHRSAHDCIQAVRRTLESTSVVAGGGAVEAALSIYLEHMAETFGSREQLAIYEFAQALLTIPKTLAVNGALEATDLVAKLRAYHNAAQTRDDPATKDYRWTGLDLQNGVVRNNLQAGVLEPTVGKIKMLRFATEAAVTILRIDDLIKLDPRQDPQQAH